LIYLLNRYYSTKLERFISVDPMIAQTLQPYEYAGGNPVSNVDPVGNAHWQWWPTWYIALGLWLDRAQTEVLGLVLLGVIHPTTLTWLHSLPSWIRDVVLWYIQHNWEGLWATVSDAIATNDCAELRFTIWGDIWSSKYRNGWCTGSY
jgi:hypothetical protein